MPPKKTNKLKYPIPEDATLEARDARDFELSDDEPKMINLSKEQKLTSKFITFDCPNCFTKLQLQNEIEINPKGIKCKCSPCSFKISKNDKTMNVSKNDEGDITLDSTDHSISFSFNRQITPEDKNKESTNRMITDVMKTPRSNKRNNSLDNLE